MKGNIDETKAIANMVGNEHQTNITFPFSAYILQTAMIPTAEMQTSTRGFHLFFKNLKDESIV